jgi:hypothetical protein
VAQGYNIIPVWFPVYVANANKKVASKLSLQKIYQEASCIAGRYGMHNLYGNVRFHPEEGGIRFLQNGDKCLSDYTALHSGKH